MNLFVLQWNAYTYTDILAAFTQLGIRYHAESYYFQDKNKDPFFVDWFSKKLAEFPYDAVFSVNYFPLIAEVCFHAGIKYLSWSYDCPLNVPDIEQTLGYETNYVFLFDRIQALSYQKKGFGQVFHLPLAVNTHRLDSIHASSEEQVAYTADISFVGNLYDSTYPMLASYLSDYTRGFLDALTEMQLQLYGQYLLEEHVTDSLMNRINSEFQNRQVDLQLNKEQLVYSLATFVTHKERLMLLDALSQKHQVYLYSSKQHPLLTSTEFKGMVSYQEAMPKVFKHSKINLNITVKNTQSGIPLRALDILGCGGFLLSNYQPELAEYFTPDVDFVYYADLGDACEKADFYLKHDTLRKQIAANGYARVKEEFNYTKQIGSMLATADMPGHYNA